jgi:hypothetical protein
MVSLGMRCAPHTGLNWGWTDVHRRVPAQDVQAALRAEVASVRDKYPEAVWSLEISSPETEQYDALLYAAHAEIGAGMGAFYLHAVPRPEAHQALLWSWPLRQGIVVMFRPSGYDPVGRGELNRSAAQHLGRFTAMAAHVLLGNEYVDAAREAMLAADPALLQTVEVFMDTDNRGTERPLDYDVGRILLPLAERPWPLLKQIEFSGQHADFEWGDLTRFVLGAISRLNVGNDVRLVVPDLDGLDADDASVRALLTGAGVTELADDDEELVLQRPPLAVLVERPFPSFVHAEFGIGDASFGWRSEFEAGYWPNLAALRTLFSGRATLRYCDGDHALGLRVGAYLVPPWRFVRVNPAYARLLTH